MLFKCEPVYSCTSEFGPLYAYLFEGKRTQKTSTGSFPLVSPGTIVYWKVTAVTCYPASSRFYGLDAKVTMQGFPLAHIKNRAREEAIKLSQEG